MLSIIVFTLLLLLLAGAGVLIVFLRRQGFISRSFNLALLLVRFAPPVTAQELNLQQIREKIALMEQLYSHLLIIRDPWWRSLLYGRPSFALELTIPSVGEEISFYVAMPRRFIRAMEKIIQGVFPEAHIEESRDYNIFNPEGVSAGSTITFKTNKYNPLRTYQKIEGDPMKEITNVFSKLAKVGEGAALQIVARPALAKWRQLLRNEAKNIHEGKPVSARNSMKVFQVLTEITGTKTVQTGTDGADNSQKPSTPPLRLLPMEEEKMRALETKAGKPLFEANIRLIASATTLSRAETILGGLEASFAQFNDMNSNICVVKRAGTSRISSSSGLSATRVRPFTISNTLKGLIFNFSFRTFEWWSAVIVSSEELTSFFHFPNIQIETPHLKHIKAREAPPPANLPSEGILLGYNMFRSEKADINMLEEDRRRHLYTIGQTGTGKSTFLKSMIIQDIQQGKGVCVIDPHGDMVEDLLGFVPRHRAQEVIYFNPGDVGRPMGLNMLEYDPAYPEQKTFIVNELLSIFDKLYNMSVAGGPMFEQYFRNSALLVMDDPASGNTLLEIERVLTDKTFRDHKLSKSRNIVVKNFWTQIAEKAGGEASLKDMVPYIASKFDNFIANEIMRPIIAQEKSAFNFREVMDNSRLLFVNLSKGRLGDINSSLIGLIMVGKMLMASLSRTDIAEEKRKDFYLYIDEFQNVTTDSIATILSEARKYRLDLIITHQFIGQLKEEIKKAVFGNVGSMVSFRIGSDDAEFMAKQFKPVFNEQDLLNIDNYNCYAKLLINGATSLPFSMKTYPTTKGDRETADIIKEISRAKYGRPRDEVEQEIVDRHERPLM